MVPIFGKFKKEFQTNQDINTNNVVKVIEKWDEIGDKFQNEEDVYAVIIQFINTNTRKLALSKFYEQIATEIAMKVDGFKIVRNDSFIGLYGKNKIDIEKILYEVVSELLGPQLKSDPNIKYLTATFINVVYNLRKGIILKSIRRSLSNAKITVTNNKPTIKFLEEQTIKSIANINILDVINQNIVNSIFSFPFDNDKFIEYLVKNR